LEALQCVKFYYVANRYVSKYLIFIAFAFALFTIVGNIIFGKLAKNK